MVVLLDLLWFPDTRPSGLLCRKGKKDLGQESRESRHGSALAGRCSL